jgi:hypothetical protein
MISKIIEMIPKIIHQIWIGTKQRPDSCMRTWYDNYINQFPDYKYYYWDEEKINKLLEFHQNVKYLYEIETNENCRIDIARYIILYYYGGIYINTSIIWNRGNNFDEFIRSNDFFVMSPSNQDLFMNSILGCSIHNDKIRTLLFYLECLKNDYKESGNLLNISNIIGSLINIPNKHKTPIKYIVGIHKDTAVNPYLFTDYDKAKKLFDSYILDRRYACALFDLSTCKTVSSFGSRGCIDIIEQFINKIFSEITIVPSSYFDSVK